MADAPEVENHYNLSALLDGGNWQIHLPDNDEAIAQGNTRREICAAIEKTADLRHQPDEPVSLMICAPAETPFQRIVGVVTGVWVLPLPTISNREARAI